jgi:hypothetical protein
MSEGPPASRALAARARLDRLAAAGARSFDPPAYAFAEGLLARGEALGGAAGERLMARAVARAEALEREIDDANSRPPRTRAPAPSPRSARREEWTLRLSAAMRARGLSLHGGALTPPAMTTALYDASRSEVAAMLTARRVHAEVPPGAGPYNPLAIAARALAELSTLAPAYLAALIAQLDELAPLLALPSPPADPSRPTPPVRRKRVRGRTAGP